MAAVAVFGAWEHNLLAAEMDLNRKILAMGALSGRFAYIVQMLVWTGMLLGLGYIWGKILFPKRILAERIVFSLILGIAVMPISFVIPYFIIVVTTVFSTLFGLTAPDFVSTTITNIVNMFYGGQEQIYEFANVFGFFVVGIIILAIKQLFAKKTQNQSV